MLLPRTLYFKFQYIWSFSLNAPIGVLVLAYSTLHGLPCHGISRDSKYLLVLVDNGASLPESRFFVFSFIFFLFLKLFYTPQWWPFSGFSTILNFQFAFYFRCLFLLPLASCLIYLFYFTHFYIFSVGFIILLLLPLIISVLCSYHPI